MGNRIVRTVGLTCLVGLVALATEAQGAATMSLKAVAKNGVAIAPTNSVSVAPNDVITAEIFVSGWNNPNFDKVCVGGANADHLCSTNGDCPGGTCSAGTGLVQTYQATVLGGAGAISNGAADNDTPRQVLPVGWVAPIARDNCPCDNPAYPNCDPLYGCIGAGHAPNSATNVCVAGVNAGKACNVNADCPGSTCTPFNINRSDYIFFGFDTIRSTSADTLSVKWGGTINGSDAQTAPRCAGGGNAGGSCSVNGDCPGSTCNANFQSYAGTLNLKVGAQACGTYTFNLAADVNQTFIGNGAFLTVSAVPATQGLTLTVPGTPTCPPQTGACCDETAGTCTNGVAITNCTGPTRRFAANVLCANLDPPCQDRYGPCCDESNPQAPSCSETRQDECTGPGERFGGFAATCSTINPACAILANQITGVDPAHCVIDARRPFPPNTPAQREGIKTVVLTFANPAGSGEDAAADFQVSQVPATTPPVPPTIQSVQVNGNNVTINFNVPGQINKWTCVRHIASNSRRCFAFLPGDASGNLSVAPADILSVIDHLNNVTPLPVLRCDMDRTGVCAPADILTVIDLLNGANGFPNQNGRTLEACPSTTP